MKRILTDRQQELLTEARHQLEGVLAVLARFEASRDDQEILRRSLRQLDELFLLVVAGEFNSGKSTFINALLGRRLLEEGVTPTTTRIHTLTFGESEVRQLDENGIERVEAPVELLRQVQIVDTPGTNALDRQHELITQSFIPRSDLVLFVTSADRPFTESERAFIEQIRGWGKKLVFIVNKIDILSGDAAVAEIEAFITENAQRLLGFSPEIFAVSSRQALVAKTSGEGGTPPPESRFAELERYLVDTLDEKERVRLKLLNPVGVGVNLVEKYVEATEGRLDLLEGDVSALNDIERQLGLYREDLSREFRFRLTDVDNVLHDFEKRGLEFFDETIRLTRAFELINRDKIRDQFERKVVADAPQQIEQKVEEVIDWMVGAELRQWQTVNALIADRRAQHAERIVGQVGSFDYDRGQLLDTVGRRRAEGHRPLRPHGGGPAFGRVGQDLGGGHCPARGGGVGLGRRNHRARHHHPGRCHRDFGGGHLGDPGPLHPACPPPPGQAGVHREDRRVAHATPGHRHRAVRS